MIRLTLTMIVSMAAVSSLAAQQDSSQAAAPQATVTAPATAAPASAPSVAPAGPRVHAGWTSAEPKFSDAAASTARPGYHTITVSTLVLVLAVVILVLLIT